VAEGVVLGFLPTGRIAIVSMVAISFGSYTRNVFGVSGFSLLLLAREMRKVNDKFHGSSKSVSVFVVWGCYLNVLSKISFHFIIFLFRDCPVGTLQNRSGAPGGRTSGWRLEPLRRWY